MVVEVSRLLIFLPPDLYWMAQGRVGDLTYLSAPPDRQTSTDFYSHKWVKFEV